MKRGRVERREEYLAPLLRLDLASELPLRGETSEIFPVLRGLATLQQHRGDFRTARQLALQLLKPSRRSQDPALRLQVRQASGTTALSLGDHAGARRDLHCEAAGDLLSRIYGGFNEGWDTPDLRVAPGLLQRCHA